MITENQKRAINEIASSLAWNKVLDGTCTGMNLTGIGGSPVRAPEAAAAST